MTHPSDENLIAEFESSAEKLMTATAGGMLTWRIWGEGTPLVLLHGGHGSWKHWFRNIPVLQNHFRLYVPDMPGMGDSRDVEYRDIADVAGYLASGLEELGVNGEYFLAGFSFGAQCAAHLHRAHRGRVRKAYLLGSIGMGRYVPLNRQLRRWRGVADEVERLAIHRLNFLDFMVKDPAKVSPFLVKLHAQQVESALLTPNESFRPADIDDCLTEQPVPLMTIWGEYDALVKDYFDERIEFLKHYRPEAQYHIIPGAGHWIMYEAADEVNQILLEDLRRQCAVPEEALAVSEAD